MDMDLRMFLSSKVTVPSKTWQSTHLSECTHPVGQVHDPSNETIVVDGSWDPMSTQCCKSSVQAS